MGGININNNNLLFIISEKINLSKSDFITINNDIYLQLDSSKLKLKLYYNLICETCMWYKSCIINNQKFCFYANICND